MQNISEKLFRKKASSIAFVLCFALQLLCSAMRYVYSYALTTQSIGTGAALAFEISVEFLGMLATYAGYAIIIYIVFIYGMRKFGEWTLAVFAGYGLCYFLVFYIGELGFGVITSVFLAVGLATVFMAWTKGCREVAIIPFLSCLLPYVSAFATLFSSGEIGAQEIQYNAMYGFLNLSTDFMVIIVVALVASVIRTRALNKEDGVNIIIKGVFPGKNPLLRAVFAVDVIYTLLAAVQYVINNVSDIKEYGWPVSAQEWADLITPYITLLGYFAAGYVVMYLISRLLENAFVRAQEESEAIERHFHTQSLT